MTATADEIAEWLMLARDRARYGSRSSLNGSADVHAAGELLSRLAQALMDWDNWRADRVIHEAAHVRRILAAAAYRSRGALFMFRYFVAEHLDAALAHQLEEKNICVLMCAIHVRRPGRPRKDAPTVKIIKRSMGLSPDEEIPDKIEALQRLAASIGIPRISSDAVEDQVQPLLARLKEIERERGATFAELKTQSFGSQELAREALEDADIYSSVLSDEAVRCSGTRKKALTRERPNDSKVRAVAKSRRQR